MTLDQKFFWATVTIVGATYLLMVVSIFRPDLKFRTYLLNLTGLVLCGWVLTLTQPDPMWEGLLLLNLAFQNATLAARREAFTR